jgi:hypothetical protein
MTGTLALLTDGTARGVRTVVTCCRAHHTASDCTCCPECVTNLDMQRRTPAERAVLAQESRELVMFWRAALALRWERLLRATIDDRVRALDVATHHAAAMPTPPVRPLVPELDAACPRPSAWFAPVSGIVA